MSDMNIASDDSLHDDLRKNFNLFLSAARKMCNHWRINGLTWVEVVQPPDDGDSTKWMESDEIMDLCNISAHYNAVGVSKKEQIELAVRAVLNDAFEEVYKSILVECSEFYDLYLKDPNCLGRWSSFRKEDLVWEHGSGDAAKCRIAIDPINIFAFESAAGDDENVISCNRIP
jgi:hypothetical protein